jgi:glycosyltransferase involved in cell wall biosynthesis
VKSDQVELSVIVCTYNPKLDLLATCLRAISIQSLDSSKFELIIVDNNSTPPLDEKHLANLACRDVLVVKEMRQGLVYARIGGINVAKADTLCFIDDDNEISADYLEMALKIAKNEPELGTWGGVCEGVFTQNVGFLQKPWLPHLGVREIGDEPLTGSDMSWGSWEPIGAGICVRKDVGLGYKKYVEAGDVAGLLGRKGKALMSGEDSLLSRIAHLLGYQCGYRPRLHLFHHITSERLKLRYLSRLMEGHGRSYYQLATISGKEDSPLSIDQARKEMLSRFLYRVKNEGLRTALGMIFWDKGYFAQVRDNAGKPGPECIRDVINSSA